MELAIKLAHQCPPSHSAFSVGAVIVDRDGHELARGYSREGDPHVHAEESALIKLGGHHAQLVGATLYSTLEPCSERKSRPASCAQHILAAGIGRVVIAWREPALFVDGRGADVLQEAGVEVVELPDLAPRAQAPNAHLPGVAGTAS
jgi:diaminohydroxyphosphoribosylaminopyrimidine deaminase / 5-amino-6-(5-phosphoribosylamino)uracil reductase